MTVAVLADIHANHIALSAAKEKLSVLRPDHVVFLGDYVTDCPYPEKTMALLYEIRETYPCTFIRGNREDYLLSHSAAHRDALHTAAHHRETHRERFNDTWEYGTSSGSLLYTMDHLTEKDLDFFASMPICTDIALSGCPILTACHGSPVRTKDWLKETPHLIRAYAERMAGEFLLCGHTHKIGVAHPCANRKKTVLFCPSLGLPQESVTPFGMTLLRLEGGHWQFQMTEVPWDREALIREFDESGLSEAAGIWAKCVIRAIRDRRDYPGRCVALAWRIAKEENYIPPTGKLPELYWEKAVSRLGIE